MSELAAQLAAQVTADLNTAAGATASTGIVGVTALPLERPGGAPFWVVVTRGMRSFRPLQNHFLAVYSQTPTGWQEVSHLTLDCPDTLNQGALRQVKVESGHSWLEIQGGAGAHGGCYDLVSFDGRVLRHEVTHLHSSPAAGQLTDLFGDGAVEVVLDVSEQYVFCYACGVRFMQYRVLGWDGSRLSEIKLATLSESTAPDLRRLNNRAVQLAQAGLWKDAQATMGQAAALAPKEQTVLRNAALIRLHGEARRKQAQSGAYPLLDSLFYGDYPAALSVLRAYQPADLFGARPPLLAGTPAQGFEHSLIYWITSTTTLAMQAQPDLSSAYVLRAWALHLEKSNDPRAVADLTKAAQLDPADSFTAQCLAALKRK